MNHTKHKILLQNIITIIIPIVVITILGLMFIGQNKSIKILGDEFGYWMASSWMLGMDWSDVASINTYYGYGYGLLLSLILILPIDSVLKYQLALVLNALMLVAVYFIIYYLLQKICPTDKNLLSVVALTATVYTGNLYHSQFTMFETLFLLGFWLFILLLYSTCRNYKLYKIILGIVLLVYLYSSHNRSLSVVLAGLFCFLCLQIRENKYRDIFVLLIVSVSLLAGSEWIKKIYQESYLTNDYINNLHYNDYSGQVEKLASITTNNGFLDLIFGLIGKLFYLLSSTYLLGGVALYKIGKDICLCIKKKQMTDTIITEVFVFLSVFVAMGITSIFSLNYHGRVDLLIYGRYHEFFMSALIIIGLMALISSEKTDIKQVLYILISYITITIITSIKIPQNVTVDFTYLFSTGIYDSLDLWNNNLYAVGGKTILVFLLILIIIKTPKQSDRKAYPCACILLSILWIETYLYTYSGSILTWSPICDQQEIFFADSIRGLGCENNLYFYATEGHQIDHLQFLLEDTNIKCIFSPEQIKSLPSDACIITQKGSSLPETGMLSDYKQATQSTRLQLWVPIN